VSIGIGVIFLPFTDESLRTIKIGSVSKKEYYFPDQVPE